MKNLDEFANAMADEALRESAENYFGKRLAIEEEIDHLQRGFKELHRIEVNLICQAEVMRYLLLDKATTDSFYAMLGVQSPRYVLAKGWCLKLSAFRIPFAFTARGRYMAVILDRYRKFDAAIDAYLHGKHVDDPFIRNRKVQTVNLEMLSKRCDYVNKMIDEYNRSHATESVLQFAKSMDTRGVSLENIVGGGIAGRYADMGYHLVDIDAENFSYFPDLPHIDGVKRNIRQFCSDIYAVNKSGVLNLLRTLRHRH